MSILFLTTIIPRQQKMGSEVASQCFIDALKQKGHEVTVVGYMRQDDVFEPNSQEIVISKRYIETKKAKLYPIFWFIISLFKGIPYSAAKYYSSAYVKTIKSLVSSNQYDAIIIEHSQLGWLAPFIKNKDKLIFIAHNIEHEIYHYHFQKSSNLISKLIYKREARLIKRIEDKLVTGVRQVWALTEHDAKYFRGVKGAMGVKVFPLSPGSGKLPDKPINKKFDIGLIGSWLWKPNQEALHWFLQNVYPQLPNNLSIHVAGKGADWLIKEYPNIHYRGIVPNAQEFMAQAKVVAVPTLSGGGIQIKTLDAIASGSLLVATPVAMRGIPQPPLTVKVAKTSEEFTKLLVKATASSHHQETFHNAKNWYCLRRNKFFNEIDYAIKAI
ncbi:glycosyl transferase [Dulcicalothrix desertica PCC 7102]|uniref:Glycosyl transferase n=1 Tax=Dulcicalothrix desertica PCC 7102 TaxID=232991 RepID=A0A3S1J0H8_9CYAN|nr:glycosyltransferase [Dulcicalothrix desertica]RUT05571.1 glycosyl transferase [Dulcicalothrix desertica PCC 7102]TWH54667.1 glycosyl transferase family 1 [Dulcicalothrix desertica PCC 7102]